MKKMKHKKQQLEFEKSLKQGPIKIYNLKQLGLFWKAHWDFFIVMAILILGVYANSLNGEFVSDDLPGYVNNPHVRNIELTKDLHLFISAVSFKFFGLNPFGSHLASTLLHILMGTLVFSFLAQLTKKRIAMAATILFALHPVNTEAVSWISGRIYLIIAVFALTTFMLQILYKTTNKIKYFWMAFLLFSSAVYITETPQSLAIFPMLIVLDQLIIDRKINIKKLLPFSVYLIPIGIFLYKIMIRIGNRVTTTNSGDTVNYLLRLPYSVYKALNQLILPTKLSLYHDAQVISPNFVTIMIIITVIFIAIVIKMLFKNKYIAGWILFGLASVFYMFSPVMVAWMIADRYLYLATISFGVLVATFLDKMETEYRMRNFFKISLGILILLFGARVVVRNIDWQSRKNLWESTARVYPNSARAYNNLGDVYSKERDFEKSINAFKLAVQLNPNYFEALHNLGYTYLQMGDLENAEIYFSQSVEINPGLYQGYFHLGIIAYENQNVILATEYMQKALEINPEYELARAALEDIANLSGSAQ